MGLLKHKIKAADVDRKVMRLSYRKARSALKTPNKLLVMGRYWVALITLKYAAVAL